MKVYYLNRERFSKGDTKIAFEFAKKLILENPNLKILTFLVYQQRQYEAFCQKWVLQNSIIKIMGLLPKTEFTFKYIQ